MYNKTKIRPHSSTSTFTTSNGYTVSTHTALRVTCRKNTEVEIYSSEDSGLSWNLLETISFSDRIAFINLTASVTHLNFTSTTNSKVSVFETINGQAIINSAEMISGGDEISSSEETAILARVSDVESKNLSHRNTIALPPSSSRVSGASIALGSDGAGLDGKARLIFINGLIVHEDDYTLDNSGNMTLSFDLQASADISILAWE